MALKTFLHVFALGLWGGCVAVEMLLEVAAARDPSVSPSVARFHDAIDRCIELPLLALIVGSGIWLLAEADLTNPWLWAKLAAASAAISANLLCVIPVVRRKRAVDRGDLAAVRRHSLGVFVAFGVGFPCAAVALGIALWGL